MSYSASSPDLSDSGAYPTFFRTCASDAFQGKAIAQFLNQDLGYTEVCTINGKDSYSAKGAAAFSNAAYNDFGMNIVKSIEINENPTDGEVDTALIQIERALCRVVFVMSQAGAAGIVIRDAVDKVRADGGDLAARS